MLCSYTYKICALKYKLRCTFDRGKYGGFPSKYHLTTDVESTSIQFWDTCETLGPLNRLQATSLPRTVEQPSCRRANVRDVRGSPRLNWCNRPQFMNAVIYDFGSTSCGILKANLAKDNSYPVINPNSAEIDLSRQNLTSVDVKFWRLKSIPALLELKYF